MQIPLYQVDAFTNERFSGNPAAVCLLREARDEKWMQSVAAEMNLAVENCAHFVSNCDPTILARGHFIPLRRSTDQVLVAVANPWDYSADEYCAGRFPNACMSM